MKLLIMKFLQPPITSSLLEKNVLLSILFSNTLGLFPSFNVRDQVSRPHKTTGKIGFVYFNLYVFREQARTEELLI
jgi:hypothetical protein